jgi:hypothetical protein
LLGPTHKYKRVHDLIVWPCGFLKYTHKSQGVCILPHKMHIYYLVLFAHFLHIFW